MKKLKLLYILNETRRVNNFSYSSECAALDMGFEFHIAGNWSYASDDERMADEQKHGIKIHQIDFIRSPYNPGNIKAYKKLLELVKREQYDIIHCNTPIGGLLGRLVGKKCNVKKVIYQVHGFHFYKGAPKKNWLIYYPIEKWLARYTDALVTRNHGDLALAKEKMKLRRGGKVYYVPGVGIDSAAYVRDDEVRRAKREELGLSESDVMLVTMGNLDRGKNFDTLIRAISLAENKRTHLFICGEGPEKERLASLAKELSVSERVHLLGYRTDMKELLFASDIFVFSSFREGLSRSVMEAMAVGLPCIVSKIRGNVDLIEDGKGGFLVPPASATGFAEAIDKISGDAALAEGMSAQNLDRVKKFDFAVAKREIAAVYRDVIETL